MTSRRITVRDTRRALAELYPGIEFTIGKGRRGVDVLTWTGGPDALDVRTALDDAGALPTGNGWPRREWRFVRHPTPAELEELNRKWDAEEAARAAAEPARRIAAKVVAAHKRAATIAKKRTIAANLAQAFPGVEFDIRRHPRFGDLCVSWEDGP